MSVKKNYLVQIVIDILIILLGVSNYFYSSNMSEYALSIFSLEMLAYGVFCFIEFALNRKRKEPIFLAGLSFLISSLTLILTQFPVNILLSLLIIIFIFGFSVIKILSLYEIYQKYTHLFIIKLTIMSTLILVAILVSINLYYQISSVCYMLGFFFTACGILELFGDFLSYLSDNINFLRE